MLELIPFAFFGSTVLFVIIMIALFIGILTSEFSENYIGYVICITLFLVLNFWWGNVPVLDYLTLKNIVLYLIIGFAFSLIRTYAKGKELKSSENKKYFDLKDHVFRWWLGWPFALITWLIGNLIKDLFDFVYSRVNKVYEYIFNL